MKKILYIVTAAAGVMASSCGDFLGKHPSDQSYVNGTTDLKELLLGETYQSPSKGGDIGMWIHLMDDDVTMISRNTTTRPGGHEAFWWEPEVGTDGTWNSLYERINSANGILEEVERFTGDPLYRRVKGEALFLRGAYYYFLVNIYAAPYNAATADRELGVPLKLASKVEDKRYSRNSLAACYAQIVADLTDAVSYLEGLEPERGNKYRAGEMAARLLLSRVYLYMGEWQKCVDECTAIIRSNDHSLLDFTLIAENGDAVYLDSPETIFSSGQAWTLSSNGAFGSMIIPRYTYSDELWATYTSGDRRASLFRRGTDPQYGPGKRSVNTSGGGVMSDFFALRLPEALLNRAEAYVMLGTATEDEAIADLQALREKRIAEYDETIGLTGSDLAAMIRDERRREFCFEGHRWFDLRRYAVNPDPAFRMQKEIHHPYGEGAELDTELVLGEYDDDAEYYVLPLPENEIQMNGGVLVQNPPRILKKPATI